MSIRWERVNGFSAELGFAHEWSKDDYIPESLYYLLGMKASSEQALKYQMWIATEVLPSVRKHGMYATDQVIDLMVEDPDFGIQLLTTLKEEKAKRKALEHENSVMKPKAEYFDALVDRNLLTSFRDTLRSWVFVKGSSWTSSWKRNIYIVTRVVSYDRLLRRMVDCSN